MLKYRREKTVISVLSVIILIILFVIGFNVYGSVSTKYIYYPTMEKALEHSDTVFGVGKYDKKYYHDVEEIISTNKTSYGFVCTYITEKDESGNAQVIAAKVVSNSKGYKAVTVSEIQCGVDKDGNIGIPDSELLQGYRLSVGTTIYAGISIADTDNESIIKYFCDNRHLKYEILGENVVLMYVEDTDNFDYQEEWL